MKKLFLTLLFSTSSVFAGNLYFANNVATNSDWNGSHWNTTSNATAGNTTWTNGETAVFAPTATHTITLGGTTGTWYTVAGITIPNIGFNQTLGNATVMGIEFATGAKIDITRPAAAGGLTINCPLKGDFELVGNSLLQIGNNARYTDGGTITVSGSTLQFNINNIHTGQISPTHILLNGGILTTSSNSVTITLGNVTINSGTFAIANANTNGTNFSATSLSGTGGTIQVTLQNNGSAHHGTLAVNQDTNTTCSSNFVVTENTGTGVGTYNYITLNKAGTGTLTLNGSSLTLGGAVNVNAGTLLINSMITSFNDLRTTSGYAIRVKSGATLGGNGVINIAVGTNFLMLDTGGILLAGNGTAGSMLSIYGPTDLSLGTIKLMLDSGLGTSSSLNFMNSPLVLSPNLFSPTQLFSLGGTIGEGVYTIMSNLAHPTLDVSRWTISNMPTEMDYSFEYNSGSVSLTIAAIPEPASLLLIGLGLGMFALLRRKKVS